MAKNVVTLYIDDTGIRLLVANSKRVEKWAQLPLERGLVSDGVIVDETKVAAKIQELLKEQGIKATKVVTGLSGLHCLTQPVKLPPLPKSMLPEAMSQEAKSRLPVPLEQLYLSWQVIRTSGEEMQVFLVATPRNATDALIKTLRLAGLDPYLIGVKPLALARVANAPTAIIIDAQLNELDIIIMVDGIPQPVRTLSLSGKAPTLAGKLPTIIKDLEQTITFYNSSYPENPLDSETPIFVSGELVQDSELYQFLASKLEHPVLPLPAPVECPEDMVPGQYMVNIGLALKELSVPKAKANFVVVNLNALPEVYKPEPVSVSRIAKALIASIITIIAIAVIFVIFTRIQDAAADTELLRAELNATNQLFEQRIAQTQEIGELETEVDMAKASRDTFIAAIDYIETQRIRVNSGLAATMAALPNIIDLRSISHSDEQLTISGVGTSEFEILSYAKKLRESGLFSQVTISAIEDTLEGMSFTLTLLDEE